VLFLIYVSGMAGFIDSGTLVVMYMAETVELSSEKYNSDSIHCIYCLPTDLATGLCLIYVLNTEIKNMK